jgi:hypothetical protein
MTVRELLENAHLDALGLLDEDERLAFEKAFRAAPPAVRAHVRDEQGRWARMESSLPRLEPGDDLRERVLNAIASEIELEAASELAHRPADHSSLVGETEAPKRRTVPAIWQGFAIAAFSAAVLLGGAFFSLLRSYSEIENRSRGTASIEMALSLTNNGERMQDILLDPASVRQAFSPAADVKASATLWSHPDWNNAGILIVQGLATAQAPVYRLIATDESGLQTTLVAEFRPIGSIERLDVNLASLSSGTKLSLVPITNGQLGQPVLSLVYTRA